MGSEPSMIEISSDDDDEDYEVGLGKIGDLSFDWLEAMPNVDGDDLVVLGGVSCDSGVSGDVSDDDCVVLEGDPDAPVKLSGDGEDGSDELLVVAEKGQLACRDYPHPRHLCAMFPFRSTPHEKHCHLCHCYVCDSLAPCTNWGSGLSAADHCHSTDKESKWHILRSSLKQKKLLPLPPTPKLPDTTLSITLPLFNSQQIPPASVSVNLGEVPLLSKPTQLRPCSGSAYSAQGILIQQHDNIQPRIQPLIQELPQHPLPHRERYLGQLAPKFKRVESTSKYRVSSQMCSKMPSLGAISSCYNSQPQRASAAAQKRFWDDMLGIGMDGSQNTFLDSSECPSTDLHLNMVSSQTVEVPNQAFPQINASQINAPASSPANITTLPTIGSECMSEPPPLIDTQLRTAQSLDFIKTWLLEEEPVHGVLDNTLPGLDFPPSQNDFMTYDLGTIWDGTTHV
ncbi:hypothetical protein QJS10_CPB18g01901 [Acorus calamus]|uniref:Uncharacterized protein n=1 Tax=Acorus calamus TaxID=4465 RepID=A0AAV9CQ51_ACOCL|nr:hypothetical protein QJS10_CPB18g01901 [Acorus calamus]